MDERSASLLALAGVRGGVMRDVLVRKSYLHSTHSDEDLSGKSPQELIGMMWRLTLNAWSFKEKLDAEPRLQRHVVVLKKRRS